MRTTIARVLGTPRALVVPVVKTPGSPVWHLSWPWGMLQCWRRGDSKWGVGIGRNVGLWINAGRLEAWTKRRQRRHNAPREAGAVAPSLHADVGMEVPDGKL
jgi:hypothetical protein